MFLELILRHSKTNQQYQLKTFVEDIEHVAEIAEKLCYDRLKNKNYKYVRHEIARSSAEVERIRAQKYAEKLAQSADNI